jgi:undecaprenyl-diphosphatase
MPSRSSATGLPLWQAVALGALHGPAEVLPVSSSGHITIVPWLLGWHYGELDRELRKTFEVALHAGTAAALLIALRGDVLEAARELDRRRMVTGALTLAPAALAGLALERPVERKLGTPATIAVGLLTGSVALVLADRRPQLRRIDEVTAADALWLGLAQACALFPGISRGGATLTAARWRGFERGAASRLSRDAALPVIAGATGLKALRLRRRRVDDGARWALAAGALASFGSALGSARLIRRLERGGSLVPYAVYRSALAGMILARLRH